MITIVVLLVIIINASGLIIHDFNHQKSKCQRNLYAFKSSSNHNDNANGKSSRSRNTNNAQGTIRLNKCLGSLSRRASDDAIAEGRVTINNSIAKVGDKVKFGDTVHLDGQLQRWTDLAKLREKDINIHDSMEKRNFIYLKYWKPVGVTCTMDQGDKTNIISNGKFDLFPQRLFTVGRLDKDSSGLVLLVSDGRVNNAMLQPNVKREKSYEVMLKPTPTDEDIQKLASGVVITTQSQRDSGSKTVTAMTKPCYVKRLPNRDSVLQITLCEGRNRQIRKMAEVLGYEVVSLHRTHFSSISLKGLSEGNWLELNAKEMEIIRSCLLADKLSEES